YAAYSNERELALAEQEARKARRGLWAAASPVAPWDFRASARSASSPPASPNTNPGAVRFHGNRASRIFHAPGCEHYSCANCTVIFTSVEAAREAGFRPHEACVSGR